MRKSAKALFLERVFLPVKTFILSDHLLVILFSLFSSGIFFLSCFTMVTALLPRIIQTALHKHEGMALKHAVFASGFDKRSVVTLFCSFELSCWSQESYT